LDGDPIMYSNSYREFELLEVVDLLMLTVVEARVETERNILS
jgi:hypothetical protein